MIQLEQGELVEVRETAKAKGFTILDSTGKKHYFYYTEDRRFAKYDGWSENNDKPFEDGD